MEDSNLQAVLDFTYNEFNDVLTELSINKLEKLLELEVNNKKRKYIVERIFTRLHKLRGEEELKGIFNSVDSENSND